MLPSFRRVPIALGVLAYALFTQAVAAAPPATPEEVLEYLAIHRDEVAVVSYTVDSAGRLDPADPILRHNAELPVPTASVVKILHLAVYAREVVAGRLDPETPIRLGELDSYYLPLADGGAHRAAYEDLGIATDELGFALDAQATVPLDDLVGAMIEHSDNAVPDFLLDRLGFERYRSFARAARLPEGELPRPILGGLLARYNFVEGPLTAGRLKRLGRLSPGAFRERSEGFTRRFRTEREWRAAQIAWWVEGNWTLDYELERRAVERLTSLGRAGEYARILARVVTGTYLSPEISAVMRRHLELELAPGSPFESVGIKGGSLVGVLNDASWAIPRAGDFTGKRRITVLFLRRLEAETWLGLQDSFVHQILLFEIAFDRATAEAAQRALTGGER